MSELSALPLAAGNRRIADYWLSLWNGDALPLRGGFSPAVVRDLLPGIVILEVVPGVRVHVRLAGTAINHAFGYDITGRDLLALSPPAARAGRLANNSAVAEGAIGFAVRRAVSRHGQNVESQEIYLPFADVTEDGARLVLLHSNWRPVNPQPAVREVEGVLEPVFAFQAIPLGRASPDAPSRI